MFQTQAWRDFSVGNIGKIDIHFSMMMNTMKAAWSYSLAIQSSSQSIHISNQDHEGRRCCHLSLSHLNTANLTGLRDFSLQNQRQSYRPRPPKGFQEKLLKTLSVSCLQWLICGQKQFQMFYNTSTDAVANVFPWACKSCWLNWWESNEKIGVEFFQNHGSSCKFDIGLMISHK